MAAAYPPTAVEGAGAVDGCLMYEPAQQARGCSVSRGAQVSELRWQLVVYPKNAHVAIKHGTRAEDNQTS